MRMEQETTHFAVGAADRILAVSSPRFDMSVYEILGMLHAGGTIVIPEALRTYDPGHWAELITRHAITVWNSAPSLLEALIAEASGRCAYNLRSLRLAILGGDWISQAICARWQGQQRHPFTLFSI